MAEVEIRGLRELQRAFRQVDRDLPKELRLHLKDIAEAVVSRIASRVPWRTGEAAGSLRARATQRGAGVAYPAGGVPWKGVRADYYPWLDFGGKVGRGGSIMRPVIPGGRYVYPAIAEARGDIAREAEGAVLTVAHRANFETRG